MEVSKKKWGVIALGCVLLPALTGCVPGLSEVTAEAPAGFLRGVWHGWCAPVSLILQLLGTGAHMYESVNVGFAYDLGFYMAVISGFGGLSLVRRKKRRD